MRFLVTTTQRCGSTWLTRILSAMTHSRSRYVDCTALGFSLRKPSDPEAVERLVAKMHSIHKGNCLIFKTHDIPSKDFDHVCLAISDMKLLTLSRDFKDVVVRRFFYCRYYWPTNPDLGARSRPVAEFLASIEGCPDKEGLSRLPGSRVLAGWATEWAAFEGEFTTPSALRLQYGGMLDGTERPALEAFTGEACPRLASFEAEQRAETANTGRLGQSLFNPEGRCGQWEEWFTDVEGSQLDEIARAAQQAAMLNELACVRDEGQP